MNYPLTATQQSIWLAQQLYPGASLYNVGGYAILNESIDIDRFKSALTCFISRHYTMKLSFADGILSQDIGSPDFRSVLLDFSEQPDSSAYCREWIQQHFNAPFYLTNALFESYLIKADHHKFYWYVKLHHLIADGFALSLLFNGVADLYTNKQDNPCGTAGFSNYTYFLQQYQRYVNSTQYEQDKLFWLQQFDSIPSRVAMGKESITTIGNLNTAFAERKLPIHIYGRIKSFAKENGVSVYHYCLGIIAILFSRFNDVDDWFIGLPVLNRSDSVSRDAFGTCINVLPFRIAHFAETTFKEQLKYIKKSLAGAYRHHRYTAFDLLQAIDIKDPLYSVLFSYQKMDYQTRLFGSEVDIIYLSPPEQHEDLVIHLIEHHEEWSPTLRFAYREELFEKEEMETWIDTMVSLMERAVDEGDSLQNEIELLKPEEQAKILYTFNSETVTVPGSPTIHGLFHQKALEFPDKIALICGNQEFTYAAIHSRVTQLAVRLASQHIGPGSRVALLLPRSTEMVIGILGILMAGAAYVPIEPELPAERITYILQDAAVGAVLTVQSLRRIIPFTGIVNYLDEDEGNTTDLSLPVVYSTPEHLAYIIYTSGSTGQPKGVMITHGSVVNLLNYMQVHYPLEEKNSWLLKTSYVFDVSVTELFGWFAGSGRLVILPPGQEKDPNLIMAAIHEQQVTHVNFVPTMFQVFLEAYEAGSYMLNTLRYILLAGEALHGEAVQKCYSLMPHVILENIYGPTEATVYATRYRTSQQEALAPVSIGRPLDNVQVYILDTSQRLLPVGIAGELYIGGVGVAAGYLNQPALSDQRFITHPLASTGRLYRSGDLAKWLPDGNIVFLGRKDHQVKLRGYRIELGEIEHALRRYAVVRDACVIITGNGEDSTISAFILCNEVLALSELGQFLSLHLPPYMIPAEIHQLDEMPINASGKTDRKVLAELVKLKERNVAEYQSPINSTERRIADIFSTLLSRENISATADFFELGGHSLKASRLITQLHKDFDVKLSFRNVLEYPTVRQLASLITTMPGSSFIGIPLALKQEYYELSHAQRRLWILSQLEDASLAYNMCGAYWLEGSLDVAAFNRAWYMLLDRHEILRTIFPIVDDSPKQKVLQTSELSFSIAYIDLQEKGAVTLADLVEEEMKTPFDLINGPLLRGQLVQTAPTQYCFLFSLHHIICDGWSLNIIVREVFGNYRNIRQGSAASLEPLPVQYRDYAMWQHTLLKEGEWQQHEQFWMQLLSGKLPVLEMPVFKKRPDKLTYNGRTFSSYLQPATISRLRELNSQYQSGTFNTLLTVVNILLFKYTGQEDLLLGTVVAGRNHLDLEDQVGFYVNTLPLRFRVAPDASFAEIVMQVKDMVMAAFDHQAYPFDVLLEQLNMSRDVRRAALFDVLVELHKFEDLATQANMLLTAENDLQIRPYPLTTQSSIFDLNIIFVEDDSRIRMDIRYNTDVFDPEQVKLLVDRFEEIVLLASSDPYRSVIGYDLVLEEERRKLAVFNLTQVDFPLNASLMQYVATHANKTPLKVALLDGERELSYQDLEIATNLQAKFILSKGLPAQSTVAILMDRSLEMVVSILSIWKAGMVYLPLDTLAPFDRLAFILQDACTPFIITGSKYLHIANNLQWEVEPLNHIFCPDTDQIYQVQEPELHSMSREMWEFAGNKATDDITGGGWMSSFTGEYFSREEMDEYAENVYLKVRPYLRKDMRVLEIGCASGITMFRLAPYVKHYHGTDLSQVIIDKNKSLIAERGINNISLSCHYAHEIDQLEVSQFDLVIINSVIQNFSGPNYFRDVLEKCLYHCNEKAFVFVGDVMDVDTKQRLLQDLRDFKQRNAGKGYNTVTAFPDHQFYARRFFDDLQFSYPEIATVTHTSKVYLIPNELSLYRFDTLLTIDKKNEFSVSRGQQYKFQYDRSDLNGCDTDLVLPAYVHDDLAYIIYTSGSTGMPKGVMVEHVGMMNHLWAKGRDLQLSTASRIVQQASQCFDISIWQFFASLLSGGSTYIYSNELVLHPAAFIKQVAKDRITVLEMVPSYLSVILEVLKEEQAHLVLPALQYLLVTGETLKPALVKEWFDHVPDVRLVNAYGPTEASDDITHHIMQQYEPMDTVPVGRTLQNFSIYIVDSAMQLCPIGVKGEICVAGVGVGRGYLNEPEKTAAVFIDDPFRKEQQQRLYKTGDIGRYLPDGTIEFFGRKDQQVKIRGYRIELGEIEHRISNIQGIKDVVVVDQEDNSGNKYLLAFYITETATTLEDIRFQLSDHLPEYMIPSVLIEVTEFPLTRNGKVDRNALLLPDVLSAANENVSPRTSTERILLGIWQEVLENKNIGVTDDFFALGGHSLKATRVLSKIGRQLQVKISLALLFSHTTIESLAIAVDQARYNQQPPIVPIPHASFYEVTAAQRGLWIISQSEEASLAYHMSATFLLRGELDVVLLKRVCNILVERHDSFRTVFRMVGGELRQLVLEPSKVHFELETSELDPKESFSLENGPLLRMSLRISEPQEAILEVSMHHIIADGWSVGIFMQEAAIIYNALRQGISHSLPTLNIQYKDYVIWKRSEQHANSLARAHAYWQSKLADISYLKLPMDFSRPAVRQFRGAAVEVSITADTVAGIRQMAKSKRTTVFTVLLTVLKALLYRYSGQTDIAVGTPIAGREHDDLEGQIGYYVNTLVLRTNFNRTVTFDSLLQQVSVTVIDAYDHQQLPFDELINNLGISYDRSRSPLFDVMFVYQEEDPGEKIRDAFEGMIVTACKQPTYSSKFDLTFFITPSGEGWELKLEYDTALYLEQTAADMASNFRKVLLELLRDTSMQIEALIFSAAEHDVEDNNIVLNDNFNFNF